MTTLLSVIIAASVAACLVLCLAEFVFHRRFPVPLPSIYWPVAELGFSPHRRVRTIFRLLICNLYRRRFWNPLINSRLQLKGFDRQRHLSAGNIHTACSTLVLAMLALFLWSSYRIACSFPASAGEPQAWRNSLGPIGFLAGFEQIFNAPAIVLSRYLYLLTLRRNKLSPVCK